MPSRRARSATINERISQAQKGRTRLACSTCRARRIKCDGQLDVCGRCRDDKRPDCRYENVGTVERLAGRQRKRTLRKQQSFDQPSMSMLQSSPTVLDSDFEWSPTMLTTMGSMPPMTHSRSLGGGQQQRAPQGQWDWQGLTQEQQALLHSHMHSKANCGGGSVRSASNSLPTPPSSHSVPSPKDASTFQIPWSGGGLRVPAEEPQLVSPASTTSTAWHPPTSLLSARPFPYDASITTPYSVCFCDATHAHTCGAPSAGYEVEGDVSSSDALWRVHEWQFQCNSGSIIAPVHLYPPTQSFPPSTPVVAPRPL